MVTLLVVQHEDECPPGMLGRWWSDDGTRLDVRRPYAGDALPTDLTGHDALVVLGGHMGADDDATHPWLTPTKQLFRTAAGGGVPALGVCLGHQVAASALGGRVTPNPAGPQTGLLRVGWEEAAARDALVGDLATPRRGVHWNDDVVVELPAGAVRLATAPGGEVQAARLAPSVWGVQWHPEADVDVVAGWPGTTRALDEVRAAGPELVESWRPLAAAFLALVRARA
ncbi:type 1 glutamine amidotransferase [Nocardioides marinus]|uniref:GMP synthase (Glutamine-hydrolyzing) n=1 Tax=Nocardioides marinus TaxID=374514 RepID=A0A7Z0C2A7_9ACTN|nr:type 1 glutamine amidotransferase [Nocardioides marinus]NYI09818.1 GMP synthase (glutamine-hydrolyzing) [Nocardioides marinus]